MSYTKFYITKITCPKCNSETIIDEEFEIYSDEIYFYCQHCDFEEVYMFDLFGWQSEKRTKEIQHETEEYLKSLSGRPLITIEEKL